MFFCFFPKSVVLFSHACQKCKIFTDFSCLRTKILILFSTIFDKHNTVLRFFSPFYRAISLFCFLLRVNVLFFHHFFVQKFFSITKKTLKTLLLWSSLKNFTISSCFVICCIIAFYIIFSPFLRAIYTSFFWCI